MSYVVEKSDMDAVANAIQTKGGTSAPLLFPDGMVDAVNAIKAGGGKPEEVKTVEITTNGTVEVLPTPGSTMSKAIVNVNVPTDGDTTQEDALVTRVIEHYSNDRITSVGRSVFERCEKLKTVNLPNVTFIGTNGFANSGLTEVIFPRYERGGGNEFRFCKAIKKVVLPNLLSGFPSLGDGTVLSFVDAYGEREKPEVYPIISQRTFQGFAVLETLILRWKFGVVRLNNINAFTGTPIEKGTGYIYVPKEFIAQYRVETNWITFANQFRTIEDYPGITGG